MQGHGEEQQCVCILVTQSCAALCDLMDCSPPGSSVHGILQARILERVAIPFSRGSSQPGDPSWVFRIAGRFSTTEHLGSHQNRAGLGIKNLDLDSGSAPGLLPPWESDSHLLTSDFSHMYSWSNKFYFMRLYGELNHIFIWKCALQHPTNKPYEIYACKTE